VLLVLHQQATDRIAAAARPPCRGRTTSRPSAGRPSGSGLEEGTHGDSSGQRQPEHGGAQVPAGRRGGRHPVRVAQDRVRWAKEGKLPFLKTLGGHCRYPAAKIRALAEELREEPTA
jgi:hypothetical protein